MSLKPIFICVVAGHSFEFEAWRDIFWQQNLVESQSGQQEFETKNAIFRHVSRLEDVQGLIKDDHTYIVGIGTWEDKKKDKNYDKFFEYIEETFPKNRIQFPIDPKKWISKDGKGIPKFPTGGKKRRFEMKTGNHNKFWEIELRGDDFKVTWGKMHTLGQTVVKEFGSKTEAKKEYDKIISEKLKKGYQEV